VRTRPSLTALVAFAFAGGAALLAPAAGAQAPTTTTTAPGPPTTVDQARLDAIADAIGAAGWFGDPVAGADTVAWSDVAAELGRQDAPIAFAVLDAEPPGDSTAYAEVVLDELPTHGASRYDTVIVLSPADVGVVSDDWGDSAIDGALDASLDELRADPVRGVTTLADDLADRPRMSEGGVDPGADDGFGSFGDGFDDEDEAADEPGFPTGWLVLGGLGITAVALYSRYASANGLTGDGDDGDSSWSSSSSSSSYRRRRSLARRSTRSSSRRSTSRRSSSRSSSRPRRSSSRGRGGRRL